MKVEYKNARIKTVEEAKSRLEAGEVFHLFNNSYRTRIYYDTLFIRKGESPYRFGFQGLKDVWNLFHEWDTKITIEWFNNIPDQGILCWVRDSESEAWGVSTVIGHTVLNFFPFRTTLTTYKYAKPVSQEEVNNLIYKG